MARAAGGCRSRRKDGGRRRQQGHRGGLHVQGHSRPRRLPARRRFDNSAHA
ncbi:hypothetical protein X805_39670 [Sphaerotilus natans subsp. natans DSM 6575]|uniref:Uncharacterized protein n=1 Tax=Sphaerotilus natans subsp. natans DSM 6575 TaxID=1286631 RepID=A0A059KGF1_9BURK|nr:hypothetical protein X805_39670 [Sphaerotilus natans subsp. natans DSM 6575]